MSGRSLGRVERAGVQLAREVRSTIVGDLVVASFEGIDKPVIRENAQSLSCPLSGEVNVPRYGCRADLTSDFQVFENRIIGRFHPRRTLAHSSYRKRQHHKFRYRALIFAVRPPILLTKGNLFNPSVYGSEIRTTRGPVRSNTNQERTGVVAPARDGSRRRTMSTENPTTQKGIGFSTNSGGFTRGVAG